MGRKAIRVRNDEELTTATLIRRVSWVAAAGLWLFLVTALASFALADWPSYAVAVQNDPPRHLFGPGGALIAGWSYAFVGVGAWVVLAGLHNVALRELLIPGGGRSGRNPWDPWYQAGRRRD